jgi:hypothetical protein
VEAVTATDPWLTLPPGCDPLFKVVCRLHRSPLLVKRGGVMRYPDGHTEIFWVGGIPLPARVILHGDGSKTREPGGIRHADGSRTFELACPECRRPEEIRQDSLLQWLDRTTAAGDVDRRGVVTPDLATFC